MKCCSILFIVIALCIALHLPPVESNNIVVDGNAYSGIVVAISEDIAQPSDNGLTIITTLQVL